MNSNQDIIRMGIKFPYEMEWVDYKGETYVAYFNHEASLKAGKPMINLSYCMTKAMNDVIIKVVRYDKNKFKKTEFKN